MATVTMESRTIDTTTFRACLARFATGVTVVTYAAPEGPRGITVSAFTSVSLRPALVLVSIAKPARSHELLVEHSFAVNVLRVEQEPLARHFAGDRTGIAVPWERGKLAPRLGGALAWLECEPWRAYDAGDHTLYLGEVATFDHHDASALGFFAGRFVPIPTPIPSEAPLPYDPFELPYDA